MRVVEILLPKNTKDKDLSTKTLRQIDFLQRRMDSYVDKILDPNTSVAGKEFLKSRLRDDYYELKDLLPHIHRIAESFDVINIKTKEVVGGPYGTIQRARLARDKLDMKYGSYVHKVVPNNERPKVMEAVHKLPLTDDDFKLLKELMENPIPAVIAPIYIQEIINDDELNDQLMSLEDIHPSRDVRPLIVEWINRVMPDQMYRFRGEAKYDREGLLSPVHGYDPHMYKGSNDPITGNAYGRF